MNLLFNIFMKPYRQNVLYMALCSTFNFKPTIILMFVSAVNVILLNEQRNISFQQIPQEWKVIY